MSARTRTRPRPATTGGVGIRLPWWALALPTLGFVFLLVLVLNPSDAQAATGDLGVTHLIERVRQLVAR
ncbi:hypothetical protein ACWD5R_16430 [Streptomyces sp. NPDC002514]|uniref:hypothetical protein n=1 Tax=Streptomyces sp. NPDC001270 TaxID=3364554 RepID=UPI0036A8471D